MLGGACIMIPLLLPTDPITMPKNSKSNDHYSTCFKPNHITIVGSDLIKLMLQ